MKKICWPLILSVPWCFGVPKSRKRLAEELGGRHIVFGRQSKSTPDVKSPWKHRKKNDQKDEKK